LYKFNYSVFLLQGLPARPNIHFIESQKQLKILKMKNYW